MWADLYFLSFESFSTYCILKIQQRSTLMKRWSDFNFLFTNSSLIQWIHLALYFVIKLNLFLRISPPYFSVSYFRLEEMSVNQFKIIFKLFPEKDLNRKSNFLKSKSKWQVMAKFRNISRVDISSFETWKSAISEVGKAILAFEKLKSADQASTFSQYVWWLPWVSSGLTINTQSKASARYQQVLGHDNDHKVTMPQCW